MFFIQQPEIWKQRPPVGQPVQNCRNLVAKMDDLNRLGLFPKEADDLIVPINILNFQSGDVTL